MGLVAHEGMIVGPAVSPLALPPHLRLWRQRELHADRIEVRMEPRIRAIRHGKASRVMRGAAQRVPAIKAHGAALLLLVKSAQRFRELPRSLLGYAVVEIESTVL